MRTGHEKGTPPLKNTCPHVFREDLKGGVVLSGRDSLQLHGDRPRKPMISEALHNPGPLGS